MALLKGINVQTSDIERYLSDFSQFFNQFLDQSISPYIRQRTVPELAEPMLYSLTTQGKRLRPALLFLCAGRSPRSQLDIPEKDIPEERILWLAAAVEAIHTYSLIHDDLPAMDNDAVRRGKPSCHVRFSDWAAILAGDALNTLAFEFLAKAAAAKDLQRMVAILSASAGMQGMIAGQALDLAIERGARPTGADGHSIEEVHRYKTAALFQATCQLGACEAGIEDLAPYGNYGRRLGLLYQIQDDILDIHIDNCSSRSSLRKKLTYPRFYGLDNSLHKASLLQQELEEMALHLPRLQERLQEHLQGGEQDHRMLLQELPGYLAQRRF